MHQNALALCEQCTAVVAQGRPAPQVGLGLASAFLDQHDWVHRRTDTVRLLDADGGTRETSIDLTPRDDPALSYPFGQHSATQIVVPLAMVAKAPTAGLNVVTSVNRKLSTLTAAESAEASWALLLAIARLTEAILDEAGIYQALGVVARAGACCAGAACEQLMAAGRWEGRRVMDPVRWRSLPVLSWLLADVATGSLLLALIPKTAAGSRQVFDIRSRFALTDNKPAPLVQYLGLAPMAVAIDLGGHADAVSYSLDVQVPAGLIATSVAMPPPDPRLSWGGPVTASPNSTPHPATPHPATPTPHPATPHPATSHPATSHPATAVRGEGSYTAGSRSATAHVLLAPSRQGLVPVTMLMCATTTAVLWLALVIPGGLDALSAAANGSATLLLAGSAAVLALLIRPGESSTASRILVGMRAILICCSVSLGLATESLVGHLREPWLRLLWIGLGVFTLALATGAALGWRAVRSRT
jgi:hypothetical protein